MVLPALVPSPATELLDLLPRHAPQELKRGATIYSPVRPSRNIHLVLVGCVKISSSSTEGESVCRLAVEGSLFGESALIPGASRSETAVALDTVQLLSWSSAEIEKQIEFDPHVGLILCQRIAQQYLDLSERMHNLLAYKTPERVMLALAQLADRGGEATADGFLRILPLTHQTLGEYVGTSREVITFQLNRLRRLGLIRYSRYSLEIYRSGLEEALRLATR